MLVFILGLSGCQQSFPDVTVAASESAFRTPAPTRSSVPATVSIPAPTKQPPFSQVNLQPEDLRGTIIHFWYPWTGAAGQEIRSLVDEFNLNNKWGIVVVPVAQAGLDGIDVQLAAARQEGELPDLVVGYLHQLQEWDQAQPLVDLQTYVEDPVWGLTPQEQGDFTPVFWEQDLVSGRRLGMPMQRSAQVLYYNTSWGRELGFSVPPVAPDMFRNQVCQAARANRNDASLENDGTGGWIISTNYASALSWIFAFGGNVVGPPESGQDVYRFNSPQTEQAFAFLRGLYDTHCAWLSESAYPEAEFAGRMGLVSTGSVMDIPYQSQAFRKSGLTDQWSVIAYPSADQDSAINVYGASLGILPSSPEEQLAAWQLIRWLLDPPNHARFVEASGSFPIRASELAHLADYRQRYPQWDQALALIPSARPEPSVDSWGQVRLALGDAFTQLFRSYFSVDQIPTLLNFLDRTAADLHIGPEKSGVFDTPTPTPSATATPTRTPIPSSTLPPTRTPRPSPGATRQP